MAGLCVLVVPEPVVVQPPGGPGLGRIGTAALVRGCTQAALHSMVANQLCSLS